MLASERKQMGAARKRGTGGTDKGAQRARESAAPAGILRSSLTFQGTWRSYQARVLAAADSYLQDGRIHIVAAPGSGKTTLGIELIARADAPCLILAPSITIREQWLSRIREGFGAPEALLSNDIRRPALLTAITYQALHSCLKRLSCVEEDEDGSREELDYAGFDLYAALRQAGVRTFCLDEAHHLRSEWQKALEEVVEKNSSGTIISLTATPPYDSTPAQWNRYISLCGPIDEEISVPELVREKSLCPHQDYVYFNMPTPEEEAALQKFRRASARAYRKLMGDAEFAAAVATHTALTDPAASLLSWGEKRRYLLALVSFLTEKKKAVPAALVQMTEEAELPPMDAGLLAVLLQGFLFDDTESYGCAPEYREQLAASLRAAGLIHKNRVELSASAEVDRLLTNSRGKLKSIREIVKAEYKSLGNELRLLILTDYIRSEYLSAIGEETAVVEELGVVPIFEAVRRGCSRQPGRAAADGAEPCAAQEADGLCTPENLRLAALSGSVVILPEAAREPFLQMTERNGQKAALKACGAPGYYQASVSGKGPRPVAYLTELFYRGYIRVLVGTKSLLGEGWDSPCINALILASFVGSFMLSNQMRGRAIRTMRDNPDKVSNIWHLICMEPVWSEREQGQQNGRSTEAVSADFATLRRRFDGFLGVHYEEDRIENGLDRLSVIRPPYGNRELDEINEKMIRLADDRGALKEKWERTLANLEHMETVESVGTGVTHLKAVNQVKKQKRQAGKTLAGTIAAAGAALALAAGGQLVFGAVAAGAALVGMIQTAAAKKRAAAFENPQLFLQAVGDAVLGTLEELGEIKSPAVRVEVRTAKQPQQAAAACQACLRGGTEREKTVFADVLAEFFGTVTQQRYLLKVRKPQPTDRAVYPVPELCGRRKEDAGVFAAHIAPCIGACDLIFTRSEDGRRTLLRAGLKEAAADDSDVTRRKCVRNGEAAR